MDNKTCEKKQNIRMISLDVFRGISVLLMLMVNNFGVEPSTPKQLIHTGWQGGVHLADMVFPWFLLCVGISIPFSRGAFIRKGGNEWQYLLKVIKRTLILILLGCVVSSVEAGSLIFVLGVLQLIGLSFLLGALLNELPIRRRLFITAVLLVAYWAAIKFLPIPGVGIGLFDDGRNIVHHFNQKFLASVNLEGLPLIIPTSALVIIGTVIGSFFNFVLVGPKVKFYRILSLGIFLLVSGFLWNLDLQANKPLWTPAFVLISTGAGAVLIGLLYLLIDVYGKKRWIYPFTVFGSSAILVFAGSIIFKEVVLHQMGILLGGWLRTTLYIVFWWIILWALYRKKIFIKA